MQDGFTIRGNKCYRSPKMLGRQDGVPVQCHRKTKAPQGCGAKMASRFVETSIIVARRCSDAKMASLSNATVKPKRRKDAALRWLHDSWKQVLS